MKKKFLSGVLFAAVLVNCVILPANAGQLSKSSDSQQEEIPISLGDSFQCKQQEWEVLLYVNSVRIEAGLEPLSIMMDLQAPAKVRAEEAGVRSEHVRPDGREWFTVLDERNLTYYTAGENIAWGQEDAAEVMVDWMNSPTHKENILSGDYTHIGVGYHNNNGYASWSQMYTGSCSPSKMTVLNAGIAGNSLDVPVLQIECKHGTAYMPLTVKSLPHNDVPVGATRVYYKDYTTGPSGKSFSPTLEVSKDQFTAASRQKTN